MSRYNDNYSRPPSRMPNWLSTRRLRRTFRAIFCLATLTLLAGCATPGNTTTYDPWQRVNRDVYRFNDKMDHYAIKPIAQGYKKVTPDWFRAATGRVLNNLEYPITFINQLLQGKPLLFLQDTGRFITNSTLGLAGVFDVADRLGMPAHDEDFGQTLAVWGVPAGPYVNIPILGPSSLRDAPARIPDYLLHPFRYYEVPPAVDWGQTILEGIDTRATLLATDATLDSVYDKYGVIRDAWVQRRQFQIYDGNPPEEEFEEFKDESEPESKPESKDPTP